MFCIRPMETTILGDPGAVSGGEEKSKKSKKSKSQAGMKILGVEMH